MPIQLAMLRLVEPMRAQKPSATARLRMEHRAVPLEHAHARLQQRPVAGARQRRQRRNVTRARDEQPHVDAVARGRCQCLHVSRRAHEVGVGQPEVTSRERCNREIQPIGSRRTRRAGDHAHARVVPAPRSPKRGRNVVAQWPAPRRPARPGAKACAISATAGPRISTPVSRHGSIPRRRIPFQRCADAEPETNATLPSTTIVLR